MLINSLKRIAHRVAPSVAKRFEESWWFRKQVNLLKMSLNRNCDLEYLVDTMLANKYFSPDQKRKEILELLRLLKDLRPNRILEIGARRGGTLILFSRVATPDARILSLDYNFSNDQIRMNHRLALETQHITCVRGDSHSPQTLEIVRSWIGSDMLDFLFIDGDHSYDGVKMDFDMYSSLVRHGGYIGFHDIVPDHYARFGKQTGNDAGEVPRFWKSLNQGKYQTIEIIEDGDQDGMGIGLIKWEAGNNTASHKQ